MSLQQQIPFPWQKPLWDKLTSQFNENKLAHAYLIFGSQGIGKELFAYEFSRYVMCSTPSNLAACGTCENCKYGFDAETGSGHPDIVVLAIEEGSRDIKIDQVRSLSDFLVKTSHAGRAKIAIIIDAHRMNSATANALLKTLEEPTTNTYLLLSTHLPGSLPATIRSRCHKISMATPDQQTAVDWLAQHVAEQENTSALARASQNRPLFALELSQSDGLENQQQFLSKLIQLSTGKTSIQATVVLAGKIGEQAVIRYLVQVSTILIKYLLINQQPSEMETEHQALLAIFQQDKAVSAPILLMLMRFYDQVQEAHRQLLGGTNPNPQLIMESLLWRWSQLSRL
jgi:DNA polymerase III subunit delta'